ncbi:MAG: response regulator [Arenimonas sp.]|uniref:ATP-binding protein n=1 Tax=Arenimonas sp. TaxID=1872635 RepID=UPI0025C53674|nr:ATP-binding protein [Arenimonas sp.]MBW8369054.1 response regulator [Arenimonas sp.]
MPNRPATFRYRVYSGLLFFSVLVILGTSILSLRTTGQLQESVSVASHTEQVITHVHEFWGVVGNSESNGLRYIFTGEPRFLEAFRTDIAAIDKSLKQLTALTADNAQQSTKVDEIRRLHMERVGFGTATMELKSQEMAGNAAAGRAVRERLASGAGGTLREDLRLATDALLTEERALLVARSQQRNQMIRQNWATVLIANSLALVAGMVGYSATRRMQRNSLEAFRADLQAEQARRSSQDKSIFLASMSHEIRTPMNAIFGFTNLLEETVTDPTQAEYLASIKKSSQALLSLINDVLDLSKMEAGKFELREEPTELHEIVDQTLVMFRQTADAKGIYLRAEYEGRAEQPLLVDPVRLRQVLINLVGNAIKYTEKGGVIVYICCVPSELDGHCDLKIDVVDTGTGIAPHQLGLIFDPFEQGDNPDGKSREGTGLGLSIARRLATLMGGELGAQSKLGEGSRFTMNMPRRALHLSSVSQKPTAGAEVDFDRLPPLEVLVVDDVAWNRDLALAYLSGSHHTVREAGDGVEALEKIKEKAPDVVLMDLRMPRMSGEQAMLKIKSDPQIAQLPVIAVTASSMREDESAVRRRFDGLVRKPYSKADLFESLARHFPAKPLAAAMRTSEAASPELPGPRVRDEAALASFQRLLDQRMAGMRASLRMREISHVATELAELAEALQWPALAAHAQALAGAVDRFDVPEVKRLLDATPQPGDMP